MKALLIFPTVFEAQAFFKRAGERPALGKSAKISIGGAEIFGIVSGIGCKASRDRIADFQKKHSFDLAILCGFCGACSSEISEGDFIFEAENAKAAEILRSTGVLQRRIASVEEVADCKKKSELCACGFSAVEMEARFFKPLFPAENFAHLRAVSDGADSKIPAEFFNSLMDFNTGAGSFSFKKFFCVLLKKPSLPIDLVKFSLSASRAKRIYDSKLFEIVKKLSDFYLQNQNKSKIL